MKRNSLLILFIVVFLVCCTNSKKTSPTVPVEVNTQNKYPPEESQLSDEFLTDQQPDDQGLSEAESRTLQSLIKVNDYPLYTMTFTADYGKITFSNQTPEIVASQFELYETLACTLFSTLAASDNMLYGRNFDWHYSPSLLLFTHPAEGYASVSMVDLAYLYLPQEDVTHLDQLSLSELTPLLVTPWMPFDGMNDQGLAIGMAAVPSGNMPTNPTKETVDSLGVIRLILDNAKNIEEALNIFKQYNIDYGNGPDLHYLIADRTGQAVLVEFYQGEMHIIYNQDPWHLATNFLCSAHVGSLDGNCWRYDRVFKTLEALEGKPTSEQAMELLDMVSQQNTQWSVLYQLSTGEVDVVMGKNFKEVETFRLTMEIN